MQISCSNGIERLHERREASKESPCAMRYSELVDHLLIQSREEGLKKLHPSEPLHGHAGLLPNIRQATDADLGGGPLSDLLRAGLFYQFDALPDAHALVQDASGDLAAYWHGMIHRREADFDNARYWFRRAGVLPVFRALHREASEFSAVMAKQFNWEPYLFTGLCEQQKFGDDSLTRELVALQKLEFDLLFENTWRANRRETPPMQ